MKIVVLDGYTLNPGDLSWQGLENLGDLTLYDRTAYDLEDKDLIIERARGAQAIFTNKTPINREIIDGLPDLKYIGVLATGYDVVDIDYAKDRGIIVTNIPDYGTSAVAQMTFALLLELTNHVGLHSDAVFQGQWSENIDWCFWNKGLVELAGKTLGLIGYGKIGQNVAKIARAFDMKLLINTRRARPELEDEYTKFVDLDRLLEDSDVISLHCPLFDSTRGIINKDSIDKMKDDALIINTSRGPLIVEEDLVKALNEGKLAGAALDVVSKEPIERTSPLLKARNCIITPHIAWASKESRQRLMDIAVDNLKGFMSDKVKNCVNL